MATIRGVITDATSGQPAACTVHVLSADGRFVHPEGAVLKVGPGTPAFYCAGSFEVTVPTGGVRVLVERGTEYVPLERNLTVTETESVDLELPLAALDPPQPSAAGIPATPTSTTTRRSSSATAGWSWRGTCTTSR